MKFKIMNSKECRTLFRIIERQWNSDISKKIENFGLIQNRDGKVFLVSRDISLIELSRMRVNAVGLYLGELKDNAFRASIEGSQLIGKDAKRNVLVIEQERCEKWMRGEDIPISEKEGKLLKGEKGKEEKGESAFLIIKYRDNFLGCGRLKESRIINFVPKNRRIKELAL